MSISIGFADDADMGARIKVVGVGGGGGNALNTMISSALDGVEFIAGNTDVQALAANLAATKIQLGPNLTKGLGAGANPDVGRKSALEDVNRIAEALQGADMVFVTAGMGGGTGSGAAPIIAQIARDQGALTVGVVTKPFLFEGKRRMKNAENAIRELAESVDTIITIPNQKLIALADEDMTMLEAFRRADDVLVQAVRGISDLIVNSGMINVDFADVKTIMSGQGRALMGTGWGKGARRAIEAAEMAIHSPLLDEVSMEGASGILINFTGGPDMRMKEINEAASLIQQAAHEDANIIFGQVIDPEMGDMVKVTVIATGFDVEARASEEVVEQPRTARIPLPNTAQKPAAPRAVPATYGLRGLQGPASVLPAPAPVPATVRASRTTIPPQAAVAPVSRAPRAFGASALEDEAVLDIPAYIRRGSAAHE
jgi:cell division protein FtsZ